MELWIRSQNKKELIRTNSIAYGEWNKEYRIYINGETFGIYKTQERALEVLDEIQRYMTINCNASGDYETLDIKLKELYLNHCQFIYNMPEE